ncbi:phage tail fiber protein [Yersinia proxima]|uniref:phage tail fiber protein n=1 Tax=Yersinia proxima TaxID=2890316 RepID=UPI001D123E70|nr:hypothetical protein [Yersinia proxima]
MAWYRTGRASSVAGSNVITGVGTLWANNVFGIAPGQTLSIPGAGQVLQYEILAVDSDTKIRIATNATTTINNSEYAIVTTVANSYSALARQTSANLAVYEKLLSDWNNITTGTGNVTIIAPDGTQVIMPSFNQMNININSKLPLTGGTLTGPLVSKVPNAITLTPIDATAYTWIHWTQVDGTQGWRMGRLENNGAFYLRDYSADGVTALNLKKGEYIWTSGNLVRTTNDADVIRGRVLSVGNSGLAGNAVSTTDNAFLHPVGTIGFTTSSNWGGGPPTDISGSLPAHWETLSMGVSGTANNDGSVSAGNRKATISIQTYNRGSGWPQVYVRSQHDTTLSPIAMVYHTNNTTVDSNGFLKKASPVVKLYRDGSSETNHESEGAISERISEGVYKISGVLGFNSDDSWGGVDGGIEIPTDKNKQPLIWVDYSLEENGDLVIKTYHRTHPTSPEFARNTIKDYEDGQPIDIPAGRFVDLRVQMPGVEEIEPPLTEA